LEGGTFGAGGAQLQLSDYLHGVVPNRLDTANMARLVNGIETPQSRQRAFTQKPGVDPDQGDLSHNCDFY
jgi:hypothetical protein